MPSCVLYLRQTGTPSGGTTFRDWGPNHMSFTGSAGAVNSTAQYKFSPGAIHIPGTADYLLSSSYGSYGAYTAPMTVSAWIYISSVGSGYYPICCSMHSGSAPSNGDWLFLILSNQLRLYRWTGSSSNIYFGLSSGLTINSGAWNHISARWISSSSVVFECNGTTSSVTPTSNTATFSPTTIQGTIIGNVPAVNLGLQGYIDEVAAFSQSIPNSMFYPPPRRMIVG